MSEQKQTTERVKQNNRACIQREDVIKKETVYFITRADLFTVFFFFAQFLVSVYT